MIDDEESVALLLGRAPAAGWRVAVRDGDGAPVVIENAPFTGDGSPMPTLYWLIGSELRTAVDTLEAAGGVKAADRDVDSGALSRSHDAYGALRSTRIPAAHAGPAPSGGVGGTRRGVKCLHAHLAWYLAGGEDPVGAWVVGRLGLDLSSYSVEDR